MHYQEDGNWWLGASNGSTLDWQYSSNTKNFGDLMDVSHAIYTGDINGDGKLDLLFSYNGDGNLWSGISDGRGFQWQLAGNTAQLGTLFDRDHRVVLADFTGDRRADLFVYSARDGSQTLGISQGQTFAMRNAGNIPGFGNLLDSSRKFVSGDYNADGRTDLLFYFQGDGNWWRGIYDGQAFAWSLVATTRGFENIQ